jgi:conjugal transfer/entry exclusion protein
MTETLIISLINASGVIIAAIITCLGVVVGATRIADRKKLQQNLMRAYKDIQALYLIEQYHTQMNITENGKDNKVHVRKLVSENEGVALSGKNTLSQVKRKIDALELVSE